MVGDAWFFLDGEIPTVHGEFFREIVVTLEEIYFVCLWVGGSEDEEGCYEYEVHISC